MLETCNFSMESSTNSHASTISPNSYIRPFSKKPHLSYKPKAKSSLNFSKKLLKTRLKYRKRTGFHAKPENKPIESLLCDESFSQGLPFNQQELDFKNLIEDNLNYLIEIEAKYKPNLTNLLENRLEINWLDRANLIDWLLSLSSKIYLKRTTVYSAINHIDRYLEFTKGIAKNKFQLLGLSALLTACKMEEVNQKCHFFKSIEGVEFEEIILFEIHLLKTLKFKVNPPILPHWADYYMLQWDNFIEFNEMKSLEILEENQKNASSNTKIIQFNEGKNKIYQESFEIFDCLMLDPETQNYDMKGIAIAVIFMLLGKNYSVWRLEEIANKLDIPEEIEKIQRSLFGKLFMEFVSKFIQEFNELLPFLQYIVLFFDLELVDYKNHDFDFKKRPELLLEDIYRSQVYNPDCIGVLMKRNAI